MIPPMLIPNKQPVTFTLADSPSGSASVPDTLRRMAIDAKRAKVTPDVRLLAQRLTRYLQQKDFVGEVRALHRFVRDEIRYVKDVNLVETLQTPEATLRLGSGDCDDKATLLAALLESIGHPARFVAVGFQPGRLSHVYVETRIGPTWVPAETTEPVNLGWSPPGVVSRLVRHL